MVFLHPLICRCALMVAAIVLIDCHEAGYVDYTERQPNRAGVAGNYRLADESIELIRKIWEADYSEAVLILLPDGTFATDGPTTIFGAARPQSPPLAGQWQVVKHPQGWGVEFVARGPATLDVEWRSDVLLLENESPPYRMHQLSVDGSFVYVRTPNRAP